MYFLHKKVENLTEKLYNIRQDKQEREDSLMKQNNMLAMILAGGRGSRLHELTNKVANLRFHMVENTESLIFHLATVPTAESTLQAY